MEEVSVFQKIWRKLIPDKIKFEIGNRIEFCKLIKQQHLGELHKDKQFLVIRSPGENMGIFSIVFNIIPYFLYAQKKGYIPIVDLQNSFVPMMQEENKKFSENAWIYYFKQPVLDIPLDEVYQSNCVRIIPENSWEPGAPEHWSDYAPATRKIYDKWSKVIHRYVQLQPEVQKKYEEQYIKIFSKADKVLGVSIRAGYRALKINEEKTIEGHPVIPTCEEFLMEIKQVMEKLSYKYIFIASDDREYQQKIVTSFGKYALHFERELPHYFENDVPVQKSKIYEEFIDKQNAVQERNEKYIIETYLLSKCDSLYSCISGGSEYAYFLNGNKYVHCEFYDKGLY